VRVAPGSGCTRNILELAGLAADAPKLESIDVQPLPGQQLQVTMKLSGPAPQPLSFTIDNPARISLDLPNTELALPATSYRRAHLGARTPSWPRKPRIARAWC
jgi:hypothetical protein